MTQDNEPDVQVEGWLKTLGIESLCQWDVVVFLHHHEICLFEAEDVASLLGYTRAPVVDALEFLQILRLVERSRVSRGGGGVRMYRFTAPRDLQRCEAAVRLFALADSRAGRVVLSKTLRAGDRTPRLQNRSKRRKVVKHD